MRLFVIPGLAVILILAVFTLSPACAVEPMDGFLPERIIDGRYFRVLVARELQEPDLLQTLDISPQHSILLSSDHGSGVTFSSRNIADLLDALFEWSSNMLDMHLYTFKGTIAITRDEQELKEIHRRLYGHEAYSDKAFYVSEKNCIYVSAADFTKEVIGHEIAHVLIMNYFVVAPPVKVQEVLAGYIEYQIRKNKPLR
jgi:hypothetical protein